jgi:hypothetical protein
MPKQQLHAWNFLARAPQRLAHRARIDRPPAAHHARPAVIEPNSLPLQKGFVATQRLYTGRPERGP